MEEELNNLWLQAGGEKVGSFNDFKADMQSNEEMQTWAWNKFGGEKIGSLNDFKVDFGFTKPKSGKVTDPTQVKFSPKQDAFLNAIAEVESKGEYNSIVGGSYFDDYTQHPRKVGMKTKFGNSTAAGAFQITASTWDSLQSNIALPDFSPQSQRVAAMYLAEKDYKSITGRDLNRDLEAGKIKDIKRALAGSGKSTTWQALQNPNSPFEQVYNRNLTQVVDGQLTMGEPLGGPAKPKVSSLADLNKSVAAGKAAAQGLADATEDLTEAPSRKPQVVGGTPYSWSNSTNTQQEMATPLYGSSVEEIAKPNNNFYKLEEKLKPVEDGIEDAKNSFLETVGNFASAVGSATTNMFSKTLAERLTDVAKQGQVDATNESNAIEVAEIEKTNFYNSLPVEDLQPVSWQGMYTDEANFSTTREEGVRKANKRTAVHTNRIKEATDASISLLSPEEQIIAGKVLNGEEVEYDPQTASPQLKRTFDLIESYSKTKYELDENVGQYNTILKQVNKVIGEAKNNKLDAPNIKAAALEYLTDLKSGLQDPAEIAKVDDIINITSETMAVGGGTTDIAESWLMGTVGKLFDTGESIIKGLKANFYTESVFNLTREDIADVATDEAQDVIRQSLQEPRSSYTGSIKEEVIDKGGRRLVVKDGQVIDIRKTEDNSKIFYPSKEDIAIAKSFDPKTDKTRKDYRGSAIVNTTGQVLSDMVPMLAIGAATGGSTLGMMAGSTAVSYGSFYKQALADTGDMKKATLFAALTAPLIGYVESKIGSVEGKLSRTLSAVERKGIYDIITNVTRDVADKGIEAYIKGPGIIVRAERAFTKAKEFGGDVFGEWAEEFSNIPVEALAGNLTGVKTQDFTLDSFEETAILTTLAAGSMSGANIMLNNKNDINELIGYAATKKEAFNKVADEWVEAAPNETEKKARLKDVAAKKQAVSEVEDTFKFIEENEFDGKQKDMLTNLSLDKARAMYKLSSAESSKTKAALQKEIADIDTKMAGIQPITTQVVEETPIAETKKEFIGRDLAGGKKVFTDFDNTLYNPKTGELTAVGKELRDKLDSGELTSEDVEILTARDAEQAKEVAKFFPELSVRNSLSPEAKAAAVAEANGNSIFIDDNKDNLAATTSGEVIDAATVVPQTPKELDKEEGVDNTPTGAKAAETTATTPEKVQSFEETQVVSDYENTPVTYKGQRGTLKKDGNTWVVETPTTIFELDGVAEANSLSKAGVEVAPEVTFNEEDNSFTIRGNSYVNLFSDPLSAITTDADGNYVVRLDTGGKNSQPRNFRGQLAEDLAYQITLQKITKDNGKEFEEFINDADTNGEIPKPDTEAAVSTDAEVPVKQKARVKKEAPQAPEITAPVVSVTTTEKVPSEVSNTSTEPSNEVVKPNTLTDVVLEGKTEAGTYSFNEAKGTWSKVGEGGRKTPVNSAAQKEQLNKLRDQGGGNLQENNATVQETTPSTNSEQGAVSEQATPTKPKITLDQAKTNLKTAFTDLFKDDGIAIAFDPRKQGEMKADKFKTLVNALIDYIKVKTSEGVYGRKQFDIDMRSGELGINLEIPPAAINDLFTQAAADTDTNETTTNTGETTLESETEQEPAPAATTPPPSGGKPVPGIGEPKGKSKFSRTIERVLATVGLSDNLKEAVKAGAPPKITITREELKDLSDAILAEADAITNEKDAIEAYSELVDEMSESLGNKFKESLVSDERQFMYEIRTLKVVAQRLLDLGQTQKAADVLNKIARIGSTNGELLAQMATVDNDPDAIFLVNFGKKASKLREEVLNSPVTGAEGKTNLQAIEELNKALQEELDATKAELSRRIAADVAKKAGTPKTPKTSSTTKDVIKALDAKAEEYLKKFRDRITNPSFKSVVPGVPTPDMILAAKDFALYAYYKFAGSIVKAKEAFLSEKILEPAHSMWDSIADDLSKKEFPEADKIIAKEKILQAIQDEKAKKEVVGISPAQAIARRILKLDEAPKTGKRKGKTIQEKLADNELDQHTINELRQLVEGDFLPLTPEKRAEVMNKVDDLLYAASEKNKALRAAPWITKSKIRKDLRDGLQSLGQTVEDLVDDFTNIDVYTQSIGEEFIKRTGMTAAEAKPYIDIIEANIKEYVDNTISKKLDRAIAEGFQGDLDALTKAIASEQARVTALAGRDKTPAELKEFRSAKQRLRTLQSKKVSTIREMERRMKSPDFKRILNSILKGGLNEDTVVNAFAARLGLDVITPEQLRHFEVLRQKVEDAAIIINGERKEILKDREDAIRELKSYIYRIQDRSLLELIRQLFESAMYANVLSSPRTAEVAIFSGLKLLAKDIVANAFMVIPQDIGRMVGKGKFDFANTRLLASSIASIFAGDLKIFSASTAIDVWLGKEGISLQQSEISQKGKDRLEATLSMIDKLQEQKKIIDDSSLSKPAKVSLKLGVSIAILQQQISRLLVVGDYISRSAAIPFSASQNLAAMAIETLPSTASAREIYAKMDELINKAGVDQAVNQKAATGGPTNLISYRKRIKLDFLPMEIQNSVKEYADRIAFTGRATGFTGIGMNTVNKAFEWTSGDPIEASDSGFKASVKLLRAMAATILKFTVAPFPGVVFRGAQMLKNTTPLGLFQRNISIDPETNVASPKGLGIKFFNEHRYYGGSSAKVLEVIETNPWERNSRIAWSVVPTVVLGFMFASLFDFEDEEGNKSTDLSENLASLGGYGKNKIVLPDDNNILITGDYDTKSKEYYQGIGIQYEPHSIYRRDDKGNWKKVSLIGTYKDDSYGWVLKALSTVQERLLFGDIKKSEMAESSDKAEYDQLPANAVAGMMFYSAVGFLGEYGLTGAVEKLDFVSALLSDKPEDMKRAAFVLDQASKSTVRQLTPLSALGTYIQNVKGMMRGEDKRKGKGIFDGALGNYMVYSDFVEDFDFDALGTKIPYQPGPYGLLGGVENAVASITNEQYTVFNNTVFEDRVTNAHKIRTKYSDLSNRIKHMYPSDATSELSTVVKLGSSSDTRIISEKAAQYKGEILTHYYNDFDTLEKGALDKALKKVNDVANQHAYVEYVIDIVSSNPKAMEKLGFTTAEELREAVFTEDASGIGVEEDYTMFLRKSKSPFDKKTEGIVKMLYDANLMIMPDKSIKDKDYNRIYEATGINSKGVSWEPIKLD